MPDTVYLTKEQCHRLAGIACDALVGCQITTDADTHTVVSVVMVPIDDVQGLESYLIYDDGSVRKTG